MHEQNSFAYKGQVQAGWFLIKLSNRVCRISSVDSTCTREIYTNTHALWCVFNVNTLIRPTGNEVISSLVGQCI